MSDQFQLLSELLRGMLSGREWEGSPDLFQDNVYRRVEDILHNPNQIVLKDIIGLFRHILRKESELQKGISQVLTVPCVQGWPTVEEWYTAGIAVHNLTDKSCTIEALPWSPDWLGVCPEREAFEGRVRRINQEVTGDFFLRAVGWENYCSSAQRDALRAVLTAPQTATIVLTLPTGAGKSLCYQVPAILKSRLQGVTVVVVPTVSLCLDQERAMSQFLDGQPLAYYSEDTDEHRKVNASIREEIRRGTQRLVFTAPENLTGALCTSLYESARQGTFKMLVIDEAHIVDQWGDEFRPAFQEIAGIRRDLLRVCPPGNSFITLLLSATITEPCLDTLETLFGKPGPFEILSSVQIRPEPSYWVKICDNEEQRRLRVLEAINHLPRPIILYVTKVEDAQRWYREIKAYGYYRCGMMTGVSTADERRKLIQDWQMEKVDIIVATSAFGLGIDQEDVRTIIHACVPENVDRFYQEVGRGGRDGKVSISLILYTAADIVTASSIRKKIITCERGFERWTSMFFSGRHLNDGRLQVSVTVPPSMKPGDIDMDNPLNTQWNIRTLTLLNRTGIIELDSVVPPKLEWQGDGAEGADEVTQLYHQLLQEYRNHRIIRILDQDHLILDTWVNRVECLRQKTNAALYRGVGLMQEILDGRRCVSDIFTDMYNISRREDPFRREIKVTGACGGCTFCRKKGDNPFSNPSPRLLLPTWHPNCQVGQELVRIMRGHRLLTLFYEATDISPRIGRDRFERVIRWLVMQGVRNLVINDEVLWNRVKNILKNIPDAYVFRFSQYRLMDMPKVPTAIVLGQIDVLSSGQLSRITDISIDLIRILLLPNTIHDPLRVGIPLRDTINELKLNLSELIEEVNP